MQEFCKDGEDELGCDYSVVGVKNTNRTIPCTPEAIFGEFSSRFSNLTFFHRPPTNNFYPLSSTQVHLPLWLWQMPKHKPLPPKVRASNQYIFVPYLNVHFAETYFATVRTIVAMGVTKGKIVVLVSLQLSSSALNSSATVTFEDIHC